MDFDPSEFLAMAMSEEENAVYTAPDLPAPGMTVPIPTSTITVEGGLAMEQHVQISVPTFDMLDGQDQEESVESGFEVDSVRDLSTTHLGEPIHVITPELGTAANPHPSPNERTASPHTIKKIIPASHDESRFRREFFCGNFERVKLFRLHCTICDKHLGCAPWLTERQMRMHKLLSVAVCRKCFEFYGDINFPIEEGSELYCCWCGEGGAVFCCSTCPKIVCKSCVKRNFGVGKLKEIDENDNWACYVCNPVQIWPHRALLWGLQRLSREMRQHVALLSKEERQAKLSKDTSHCCSLPGENYHPIGLPPKPLMSRIPLCLIAFIHQADVKNQPDHRNFPNHPSNTSGVIASPAINSNTNRISLSDLLQPVRPPVTFARQPSPLCMQGKVVAPSHTHPPPYHTSRQMMHRGIINQSRSVPYAINRQLPPLSRPSGIQNSQYHTNTNSPQAPFLSTPNRQFYTNEVIDLVDEPNSREVITKPQNDISWLEKGINDVKDILSPVKMLIDQFDVLSHDLKNDFSKITTFSDRLNYNIKIAICNLAKVNQDIVDAKKLALDNKVSSVIKDIQMNGLTHSVPENQVTPTSSVVNETINHTTVKENPVGKTTESVVSQKPEEDATSSNPQVDIGDLSPALLCEAVLEVEGNKENENSNKCQKSPLKRSNNKNKGMSPLKKSTKRSLLQKLRGNSKPKVQVIDLIDDEDEEGKFDMSYYYKKFNIKPCKVVLKRCKIEVKVRC